MNISQEVEILRHTRKAFHPSDLENKKIKNKEVGCPTRVHGLANRV